MNLPTPPSKTSSIPQKASRAFWGILTICCIAFSACKSSDIGTPSNKKNLDAQETERIVNRLKIAYLRTANTYPDPLDLKALRDAENEEERVKEYKRAIDRLVEVNMDNGVRRFMGQFTGLSNANRNERPIINMMVHLVTTGKSWEELFTFTDLMDDEGGRMTPNLRGLTEERHAGFLTQQATVAKYMPDKFAFALARESMRTTMCVVLGETPLWDDPMIWAPENLDEKYSGIGPSSDPTCTNCHSVADPYSTAYQGFTNAGRTWRDGRTRAQADDLIGEAEPLESGLAVPNNRLDEYYKFTTQGASIRDNPGELMKQTFKQKKFSECAVRCMLAWLNNHNVGRSGMNGKACQDYAVTDAGKLYLEDWVTVFEENNRVPREFIRQYLQSENWLNSYSPIEDTTAPEEGE